MTLLADMRLSSGFSEFLNVVFLIVREPLKSILLQSIPVVFLADTKDESYLKRIVNCVDSGLDWRSFSRIKVDNLIFGLELKYFTILLAISGLRN